MKLRFSLSFVAGLLFMCAQSVVGQEHTIWQLGNSDGSSSEFALSPNGYKKFWNMISVMKTMRLLSVNLL